MKNHIKKHLSLYSNLTIIFVLIVVTIFTANGLVESVFGKKGTKPIYNGNRDSNKLSLMINVYWGTEFIDDMLDVFNDFNVKTTFFIGGTWAEKNSEVLKKIYEQGHEIGNHGYFHKDQDKLNYDQNYNEINITHTLIKEILDIDMTLFAPPSGAFSQTTLQVANELNYKTIMWSKDTIDWRDKNENLVYERATKKVAGGELILMHPTKHTQDALPKILNYYKNNNLIVTTVTNVIA